MKSVAIVLPCSIDRAPYVKYYTDILDDENITYEIIYWNRDASHIENKYHCYLSEDRQSNLFSKYKKYKGFIEFVKSILINKHFDFVIVFTIVPILLLSFFLERHYKGKYIYDIRDYSVVLKCFKIPFGRMIKKAIVVVVSSPGFFRWLPKREYLISHNVSKKLLCEYRDKWCSFDNKQIAILTIGQIRDYKVNYEMLRLLQRQDRIRLLYAGYGNVYEKLRKRTSTRVHFLGSYKKENESAIVLNSTFINGMTDHDINSKTLLSNRLYLCCLYRRPIIVSDGTFQAEMVRKYDLGIVVKDLKDLSDQIFLYVDNFSIEKFDKSCRLFMSEIMKDINMFEKTVLSVILD